MITQTSVGPPSPFPRWNSGEERYPLNHINAGTDVTPSTAATVYAWPFYSPLPATIASVYIGLTTGQAGALMRCGIYTDLNGKPSGLVQDCGELDLSATTGKRTFTAGTARVNGLFWVLLWMKNVATQATVRGNTSTLSSILPTTSSNLVSGTFAGRSLLLAAAYPAGMPAAAPAVAASSVVGSIPLCTVEAA